MEVGSLERMMTQSNQNSNIMLNRTKNLNCKEGNQQCIYKRVMLWKPNFLKPNLQSK